MLNASNDSQTTANSQNTKSGINIERSYIISPYQELFWYLNETSPGACLLTGAYRFKASPDVDHIQRCTAYLMQKYEVLYTHILKKKNRLYGIRTKSRVPDFKIIKCSEKNIPNLLKTDANRPFDLYKELPIRTRLYITDKQNHYLLLSGHHILFDLYSTHLYICDLTDLLKMQKLPECVPPNRSSLTWFASLNNELINKLANNKQRSKRFWHQHLNGSLNLPLLPFDHAEKNKEFDYRGRFRFSLPDQLQSKVKETGKVYGVTPFVIYLAAFKILLYKYGNTQPFTTAIPVSLRTNRKFRNVLGCFLNTIPLKLAPKRHETLCDFMTRLNNTWHDCLKHKELPVMDLGKLIFETERAYSGLYNTLFAYQRIKGSNELIAEKDTEQNQNSNPILSPVPIEQIATLYSLNFTIVQTDTALGGFIEYNRTEFEHQTIHRFLGHYRVLLEQICYCSNINQTVSNFSILTPEERDRIVSVSAPVSFKTPKSDYLNTIIHTCNTKPQRTAVSTGTETYTFGETFSLALGVVKQLKVDDRQEHKTVALFFDSGYNYIAALLGVLSSNNIVMPIDPDTPIQRVRALLKKSQCNTILCMSKDKQKLISRGIDGKIIDIREIKSESDPTFRFAYDPDSASYLLFTSGSTGEPKGVIQTHGCLNNLINFQKSVTGFNKNILQYAPVGFDVSLQEILYSLASASTLYCIPKSKRLEQKWLSSFIVDHEIEIIFMPFTALKLLTSNSRLLHNSHLQHIIQAGEPLYITPDLKTLIRETGCTLYNQYGPTETHVVTQEILSPEKCQQTDKVLIGKALPNTALYILDNDLQPVPDGIQGELYVGGINVAKGYLDDQETRDSFIDSPFQSGHRLYRTGDRVRRLQNGSIEYIGRKDQQLKIRGFRVEPTEIENVLRLHHKVDDACVTGIHGPRGYRELVGYIRSRQDVHPTQIRLWLRDRLPAYMIPVKLCIVESFPLTPSNKIDKKRLPDPFECTENDRTRESPKSRSERLLHRIWCNVLKTNALSVHDDFFQSGGHSLLAVQVINRINSQFNIELGINVLFKNPTLRQLAKVIDSEKTPRMTSVIRDIKTLDTSAYIQKDADGTILYPLSPSQRMLWFIQKMDRNNYVFNMPTCLKINGEFDADLFHRATELLVENYDILRTIFVETKDKPFQKILPIKSIRNDGYIVRKLIPADVDMDEYVQRFCRQQSKNPFILDKGPLFKTVIFESAQIRDIHYIFANLHHTISDGWGIKRIVKILETYYQHLMVDKDFIPAKPNLQYCDYCLWQIAKQKTHIPVEQKHYWENKVIKGLPRNQLPTDEPRPRVKTFDGNQIYFNIEKTLYNTLTTFAKTNGISLFAVLLAIVKILIHKHTDDKQITVGVPTEGRNHIELEDQPGLFINTIISTDLITGKETFLECVKTVFNTLTVDLQHKDYPFDLLISKFVKEHDPGHNPVTDILVSQHHAYLKGITFGNSQLEQIDLPIDKSRVDISFVFEENSGHIKCMLEYNSTLYEKSRMTRFIDQFYQLIFDAINCPNKSIQDLEYLSENELTILKRFEYHQKQYDLTLDSAYNYQVKTRPEWIAIEENDCFLSFAELNTKVAGIRDWLLSIVKKNEIIGVFLPRSIDFVVSMLGILTAGCAVMPIDPSLPVERIKHLISQSGCKKVITNNKHSALLTKRLPGIPILDINDPGSPGHKMSPFKINPSDKAFILFTSGSTGRPKGIIITHQNMISFLLASQDNIRLEKDDKFLHHTALSFDAAIMEILISLVFGITLVIADDVTKNDPDRLYRFIKAKNITTAFFTPSFIKIMEFEKISTLKKVITGGETAIADDGTMDKHNCSYLNMYGPAETTIAVTHYPICKVQKDTDIPLGKPLPNNEILILDEFLKRKPIGVSGEIYIGGTQVSDGYINNPQETRKRFIPHPFRKGIKVYRTGDLGFWGEDGNLYFRGRRDNQVKIRGIRIELDEIRQLVLQSGQVQDAVITVSKQGVHQEIVCYYIAKTLLEIGSLKRYLGKYISASVIPNRFIQIDQIPLNINGKIDYNALPKPAALPSHANTPNELTSIETKVLALWKETLDTSDIDPDKSFFEMGGNSLLVVTLQNKISNMFDLKIEIADLFQYVSVREMAKRIEDIKNKTNEKSSDSVKPMALRYNKRANQRKKRLQSRRDKNA